MPTKPKQLSVVSTKWDVENKGYLSTVQQSMRDLDEKGTGTLSADQLSIFATKMEVVSSENKQLKKLILGLGLLVVVLFASTVIGTTLTIKANKEISVTPDGLAVAPSTGLPLRTEAQGFAAESTYVLDEETGITHECVLVSDIAEMYIAYGKGMTVTYKGVAGGLEDVDENTAPIHVASGGAYVSKEQVQFGEAMKFNISSAACDRLLGTAGVSTDGSGRKLREQLTFAEVLENVQARRRKLGVNCGIGFGEDEASFGCVGHDEADSDATNYKVYGTPTTVIHSNRWQSFSGDGPTVNTVIDSCDEPPPPGGCNSEQITEGRDW